MELKNSLHIELDFASRHTFYRMELAIEMIFIFFYFTGTRGRSLVKRTTEMGGKDKLSFLATAIWENNGPLHKAQVVHTYKNLIVQKELNHQEGGLAGEKFY